MIDYGIIMLILAMEDRSNVCMACGSVQIFILSLSKVALFASCYRKYIQYLIDLNFHKGTSLSVKKTSKQLIHRLKEHPEIY